MLAETRAAQEVRELMPRTVEMMRISSLSLHGSHFFGERLRAAAAASRRRKRRAARAPQSRCATQRNQRSLFVIRAAGCQEVLDARDVDV